MELKHLRIAAEELASCEVQIRQTFRKVVEMEQNLPKKRLFGPNKEEKVFLSQLEKYRQALETWESRRKRCLETVERLRHQVPEAAGQEFWWDVPFDSRGPVLHCPEGFSFPKGFYVEMPQIDILVGQGLSGCIVPAKTPPDCTALHIDVMKELEDEFLLLYSDDDFINDEAHEDEQLTVQTVCNMETPLTQWQLTTTSPESVFSSLPTEEEKAQELLQRQEEFESHYDRVERTLNMLGGDLPLTNRERAATGNISMEELLEQEIWRSNARIEALEKTREKQRKDELLQQFLRQQEYERSKKSLSISGENLIRYSAIAGAAFHEDKLVGLWIPKAKSAFLEFSCADDMAPYHFQGKFYSSRVIEEKPPDTTPLLPYLASRFSAYMEPYDVLSPRPWGSSDMEWRIWAEARWEQMLSLSE